jgi:hypothetical protein
LSRRERAVHTCLAALALAFGFVLYHFVSTAPIQNDDGVASAKLIGKHLDAPGMRWGSFPINAVVFVNSNCHYCKASTPFYRQLAEVQHMHQARVSLCVICLESSETIKQFLASERITVSGVYELRNVAGLESTPTLLIVDATGTIRNAFVGLLNQSQQRKILAIVQSGLARQN